MPDIKEPKKRTLFFAKQVDQSSISELTKSIIEINEDDRMLSKQAELLGFEYKPKPIKIYIDSYGGKVYQILGLVSVIEKSETEIHTICTGVAMSSGFIMLISGHKRFAYKHSTPLYHQISGMAIGNMKDIQEKVEEMERLQNKLEEITLEKTKISSKKLKKIYKKKKDWYMTSEKALKLGVIDEII